MGRRSAYPGIEVRGDSIRIAFQYQGQRCRETLRLEPTPRNIKHAVRLRAEIQRKIELNVFNYEDYFPNSKRFIREHRAPQNPTFGELARQWLAAHSHLAPSTLYGYRKALNQYWMSELAEIAICNITYGRLMQVIGTRDWGSLKTRNNVITPLRRIFEMAYLDGLIEVNPAARIKNAKAQKPPPDPLTLEEVEAVLAYLRETLPAPVANYFEFAFFTGLRTSELIALTWEDIDFRLRLARVQRAKVQKQIKSTKTNQIRDVELNSRALGALELQKAQTFLAGTEVFIHPYTGRPYNDDKPPRLFWDRALKALGIRHRNAYQTRHTFATLNLMAGANPMWVARQMGHVSLKMLLEHYARWIDASDKGLEKSKMERFLLNNKR